MKRLGKKKLSIDLNQPLSIYRAPYLTRIDLENDGKTLIYNYLNGSF